MVLSSEGIKLADHNSDVLNTFASVCESIENLGGAAPKSLPEYAFGDFASIYKVPGYSDFVMKVATRYTGSGHPPASFLAMARQAMPTEFRLSHALQQYLSLANNPEKVYAPKAYAMQRFTGGIALLYERAQNTVPFSKLYEDFARKGFSGRDVYGELHPYVIDRIRKSLKGTPLRLATNDLIHGSRSVSAGNILIEQPIKSDSPLWIVDTMTPGPISALKAYAILALNR